MGSRSRRRSNSKRSASTRSFFSRAAATVLALLHEERFVDLPPARIWAQLLDAGSVPPCSIRMTPELHPELGIERDTKRASFRITIGWYPPQQ